MCARCVLSPHQSDSPEALLQVTKHHQRERKMVAGSSTPFALVLSSNRLQTTILSTATSKQQYSFQDSSQVMSNVLQIGHQLADVHISQWVKLLAEKAVATDWTAEKHRDTMQSALLDMPPHVQVCSCFLCLLPCWSIVYGFLLCCTCRLPRARNITQVCSSSCTC